VIPREEVLGFEAFLDYLNDPEADPALIFQVEEAYAVDMSDLKWMLP
jgi:hypothetical protein